MKIRAEKTQSVVPAEAPTVATSQADEAMGIRGCQAPAVSAPMEPKAAFLEAAASLRSANRDFFEARSISPMAHRDRREAALSSALVAMAAGFGVELKQPIYCDSRGEFPIVALASDPDSRRMGFCASFGEGFTAFLNAHQARTGIAPGHLDPSNGWCRMNHFEVEKMVLAYEKSLGEAEGWLVDGHHWVSEGGRLSLTLTVEQVELGWRDTRRDETPGVEFLYEEANILSQTENWADEDLAAELRKRDLPVEAEGGEDEDPSARDINCMRMLRAVCCEIVANRVQGASTRVQVDVRPEGGQP